MKCWVAEEEQVHDAFLWVAEKDKVHDAFVCETLIAEVSWIWDVLPIYFNEVEGIALDADFFLVWYL